MSWIRQLSCRRAPFFLARSTSTFCRPRLPPATVYNGAEIQIFATVKLSPNKTRIHFVWNRGLYVQGYSPTIHSTTINDISSTATIDVLSGSAGARLENIHTLKVVHGIVKAISWGVLLPTEAAIARYRRHIKSLGPAWFDALTGTQLYAFFPGTVRFAIGIRLGELFPEVAYGTHRKLGFAAFGLGAIQKMVLLFRPKTTHVFRKYWKSYQHFVGYARVVIGVVNVFQGFEAMGLSRSYAKLTYCLCLSTLIGICVSLEVNSLVIFCRKSKEEKMRREGPIGTFEKERGSFR